MIKHNENAEAADSLQNSHDHKANNLLLSLQTIVKINLTNELQALIQRADACGLVIEVESIPSQPLSKGDYKTKITIRIKGVT